MKIECLEIGTLVVFAEIGVEICLKAFFACVYVNLKCDISLCFGMSGELVSMP